jgi:hypothetical protein
VTSATSDRTFVVYLKRARETEYLPVQDETPKQACDGDRNDSRDGDIPTACLLVGRRDDAEREPRGPRTTSCSRGFMPSVSVEQRPE